MLVAAVGAVLLVVATLVIAHLAAAPNLRGAGDYQSYVTLVGRLHSAPVLSEDGFPDPSKPSSGPNLCGQSVAQYADVVTMAHMLTNARGGSWPGLVQSQIAIVFVACPDSLEDYKQGLASVIGDDAEAQRTVDEVVKAGSAGSSS